MPQHCLLKKLLWLLLIFLPTWAYADHCPEVSEVKHIRLQQWHLYDSEEGNPLSTQREEAFRNAVAHFALAEWIGKKNGIGGAIHCYYRDEHGSTLEAYLVKDSAPPKSNQAFWYNVSGFMHCAAGARECEF